MTIDINKNNFKFLFLLILADLLFIFFHVGHLISSSGETLAEIGRSVFSLGKDLGLAESFMYVKEYWVILLLVFLAWTKKKFMYLAWALLFLYIMIDDLMQMHERVGAMLVSKFDLVPMFNLRAQDFGELAFSGFSGVVLLFLIGLSYIKSDANIRRICRHLIILLMSLVLFGVVFDMIQIMFADNHIMFHIFGIIEDGGEMIILSFFCWYVFLLSEQKTNTTPFNVF